MKKKFRRAALYSVHPHELGLCGPQGAARGKLYQYLTTKKISGEQIKKMLLRFEVLFPYLKLIAESNTIEDWLDPRVVDAYWIGNDLLNRVGYGDLVNLVRGFAGKGQMTAAAAEKIAARVGKEHRPHHSFHVFVVGSITGKVERGAIGQELCRIGWGKVQSIKNDALVLRARTLARAGGKYLPKLGEEELIKIKRDPLILSRVKVGDIVTCHWGRAVEVISEDAARRLEYWTEMTLAHC